MRAFINTPVNFTVDFLSRSLGRFVPRERLVGMLNEIGVPVDITTGELRKDPLLYLQSRTADRLIESVFAMRLALVRFPDLALITSDRPLVQWGKVEPETPPFGVGLDVPHGLSLHLDPRHALLFVPARICGEAWQERVIEGTSEHADVLNDRVVQWAWERVFHHPDHAPLRGRPLPERPSFADELQRSVDQSLDARRWPTRMIGRWLFKR